MSIKEGVNIIVKPFEAMVFDYFDIKNEALSEGEVIKQYSSKKIFDDKLDKNDIYFGVQKDAVLNSNSIMILIMLIIFMHRFVEKLCIKG